MEEPGVVKNVPTIAGYLQDLPEEHLNYCSWDNLIEFEYQLDVMKARVAKRKSRQRVTK